MIRATIIAAAVCVFAVPSGAQNPPPPAPPTVSQPATPPTPAPRAIAPPAPRWDSPDMIEMPAMPNLPDMPNMPDMPDLHDLEFRLDALGDMDMNFQLPPMPDMEMDFAPMNAMIGQMDEAMSHLDLDMDIQAMPPMPPMPPMSPIPPMPPVEIPPMAVMAPMARMALDAWTAMPIAAVAPAVAAAADRVASMARIGGQSPFERQFGGIASQPPKSWAGADPADSLYRLAREALNHGEYRRAAQLFGDISQRFPSSAYAADARYWRAFALYRIGGTSDLREALTSLQDTSLSYRHASLRADASTLAARIRGALAVQGDPRAREQVGRALSDTGQACDREDLAVRIEALNSLGQTDPATTTPILRRVLARRDTCSASLRRAALWLLGRRTDAEATSLVMNSARSDPDTRVRADALRFLAAMPGDQAIATIEEIARTPGNDELQRAAVFALGRSETPRARQSIRNIIERTDLSESLRATALASVDADHSTDNGAYIRSIYPRLDTPRLKASAIRALARVGGNDNDQWLLSVVRNANEPVDVRAMALRYAGRSSIPIADLVRMYDVAGDRPLREQLISLYAQRPDAEATDKLLGIARTGTDPDMRRMAISALARKNDPRTKQILLEIIDK
jgi:HEAT repeat protein